MRMLTFEVAKMVSNRTLWYKLLHSIVVLAVAQHCGTNFYTALWY